VSVVRESYDQRDIQRLGGVLRDYPSSAIVARLLRSVRSDVVLDVTYGRGRFYRIYRPKYLVGVDPIKWEWIVKPDEFYQMSVYALYRELINNRLSFKDVDVVVVDPPKWTGANYRKRDEFNYILGTPELIIEYGFKVAKLVKAEHVLVHFNKVFNNLNPTYIIEFKWFARYLNTKNKNTSYYILYRCC
jgi:hypothetical protein